MKKLLTTASLIFSVLLGAEAEWKTSPVTQRQWMPSVAGAIKVFSVDFLDMRFEDGQLQLSGQFWNNGNQDFHDLVLNVIVREKVVSTLKIEESRPAYFRGIRFNLPADADLIRFEVTSLLTVNEFKEKREREREQERVRVAKAEAEAEASKRAALAREQEQRAIERARREKEYADGAPQRAKEAAEKAAREAKAAAEQEKAEADEEARNALERAKRAAIVERARASCQKLRKQIASKTLGSLTVDEADRRDACKSIGLW